MTLILDRQTTSDLRSRLILMVNSAVPSCSTSDELGVNFYVLGGISCFVGGVCVYIYIYYIDCFAFQVIRRWYIYIY